MHLLLCLLVLSHLPLSGGVQNGIFGGREAKAHSRPYMASLQTRGHHVCGGVLIREDYVLTAAHCLQYTPQEVVLGGHNITGKEASQQRIQLREEQFHAHPQFKYPTQFNFDIMLIKLKSKAKLSKFVKLMGLPKKDGEVPAGVKCWVAGWGMKAANSPAEPLLQEAQVQMETQRKCKDSWKQHFNSHMMCSSSSQGKGFCQGDSGGPLVCNTKVQGLVAYTSADCTDTKYPQVYTRVSAFLPWIKKMMGRKERDP